MIDFGKFKRYSKDIAAAIRGERFDESEGGLLLFGGALKAQGMYVEGVNGGDWRYHPNLCPDAGIRHILNVVFDGVTTRVTAWYLAPTGGSTTPAAGWTAANFTSNASEITSTTEGYTETTRQAATFVTSTANDYIDNYAAKAAFTIATATSLTVTGLGLLSSATRGGTSGVLASATKFATARVLQSGDTWNSGYRISLSDS